MKMQSLERLGNLIGLHGLADKIVKAKSEEEGKRRFTSDFYIQCIETFGLNEFKGYSNGKVVFRVNPNGDYFEVLRAYVNKMGESFEGWILRVVASPQELKVGCEFMSRTGKDRNADFDVGSYDTLRLTPHLKLKGGSPSLDYLKMLNNELNEMSGLGIADSGRNPVIWELDMVGEIVQPSIHEEISSLSAAVNRLRRSDGSGLLSDN